MLPTLVVCVLSKGSSTRPPGNRGINAEGHRPPGDFQITTRRLPGGCPGESV